MSASEAFASLTVLTIVSSVVCGVMAMALPRRFEKMATFLSTWVEIRPSFAVFDTRIDIDHYVLRYTRSFGAVVLVGSLIGAMSFMQLLAR